MLGSPATPQSSSGPTGARGLWPPVPPPTAVPTAIAQHLTTNASEGYGRYGVYSLFPGAGSPAPGLGVGAALYSHSSAARFASAAGQAATPGQAATAFHATHKVTDSIFSTSNYTFGAPTPPPGSPYSPVPVSQLELLAKGISTSIAAAITQAAHVTTVNGSIHSKTTNYNNAMTNSSSKGIQHSAVNLSMGALVPSPLTNNNNIDENHHGSNCKDRCWSMVKTEKNFNSSNCVSPSNPSKTTKFSEISSGCSRTNPVEWTSSSGVIHVKKEPGICTSAGIGSTTVVVTSSSGTGVNVVTPCQVAEVTTSEIVNTPRIKVEADEGLVKNDLHITVPTSITNGNIPVGIAVARQRLQQDFSSPSLGTPGLLTPNTPTTHTLKDISRISEIDAGMAALTGGGASGGTLLQCGEDRTAGLAAWPMGGTAHGSALATPTLWQYPAPMPVEPMLPLPIPMPPLGFQLVRDPSTGHFLLIPTANLEQLQQAVVWPTYPQPSSHVLLPPLPPPPPLAPLQLLSSATSSDYLATSTTLHQTHSTRLVAVTSSAPGTEIIKTNHQRTAVTAAKTATAAVSVPLPLPLAHTLIKIEADCTATTATLDHASKTVAFASSEPVIQPALPPAPPSGLVTTHVFYQHPTANLILSQAPPTSVTVTAPSVIETPIGSSLNLKNQGTSPVACLTPPPENLTVQDAGNQTESHILDEHHGIHEPEVAEMEYPIVDNSADINDTADAIVSHIEDNIVSTSTNEPQEDVKSVQIQERNFEMSPKTTADSNFIDSTQTINPVCVTPPSPIVIHHMKPETPIIEIKPLINKPDISGLELLSNSIVEFEKSRNNSSVETTPIKFEPREEMTTPPNSPASNGISSEHGDEVLNRIAHMTLKDRESETINLQSKTLESVDDNLGGLGLLCALAEQRFREEVGERNVQKDERKEKRKIRHHTSSCESTNKRIRYTSTSEDEVITNERQLERERLSVLRRVAGERGLVTPELTNSESSSSSYSDKNKSLNGCSCKDDHKKLQSHDYEDDVQHKIAINNNNNNNINQNSAMPPNKSTPGVNKNWTPAFMSAVERDMRQQLADLQRQYKEKQLELSKLKPIIIPTESIDSKRPFGKIHRRKSTTTSPSPPPPILDKMDIPVIRVKNGQDLLKPPTLCAILPSNNEIPKLNHHECKRKHHDSCASTPDKVSSSKKRKVGRPKKLMSTAGHRGTTTETIVAKKPRTKGGLVGYLLAAKNRLQMQQKNGLSYRESSPLRYIEDSKLSPHASPIKTKSKPHKNGSVNVIEIKPVLDFSHSDHRSKIRPKLKAEPTIKSVSEDETSEEETDDEEEEIHGNDEDQIEDQQEKMKTPISEPVAEEEDAIEEAPEKAIRDEDSVTAQIIEDVRCILTNTHLNIDRLRVLTAMGGLFYAGHLTAVRAPDVYAITLDGERGNRPHIMCREEILRDAIVEVSPKSTSELLPGTRLCAYWSQQYRCLYPGTVAEPGTPNPELDLKFVCVEFDDGDSGRIALEDIRLLPAAYPIIEYDPNPLLSLSKRRRRTSVNSVTEEKKAIVQKIVAPIIALVQQEPLKTSNSLAEKENTDINRQVDANSHRERKKLKKRRKEKLKKMMCHDEKKKKRKHRCCEEHCKHRKHHKKHRKHKKHHHRVENEELVNKPALEETPVETTNSMDDDDDEEENILPVMVENKNKKSKSKKERRESAESRSKMAAFLPARQLWGWSGRGYKRVGVKGRARKQFFKAIQRGKESIMVGDCAVFLSTGRPDRPYIGKIESMWESWGTSMVVKVKWFYHPEETVGCPASLKYPGALFESPHVDENDVQTISHKCEVLPLKDYTDKLGTEPQCYETIYDNNDIYYLAGYYDPTTTTLTMEPGIPFTE